MCWTHNSSATPAAYLITITLPNGCTITSTHTLTLNLPSPLLSIRQAHIFPDLTSGSLIFIGKLYDTGCQTTLTKSTVTVVDNNTTVLTSTGTTSVLWQLHLPASTTPLQANLSTLAIQAIQDRVAFLHAAAGYPSVSMWI